MQLGYDEAAAVKYMNVVDRQVIGADPRTFITDTIIEPRLERPPRGRCVLPPVAVVLETTRDG